MYHSERFTQNKFSVICQYHNFSKSGPLFTNTHKPYRNHNYSNPSEFTSSGYFLLKLPMVLLVWPQIFSQSLF